MTSNKYLSKQGLSTLWEQAKNKFIDESELEAELLKYYTQTKVDELLTAFRTEVAAQLSTKVDIEKVSSDGKALIFNELDGGGAKFESNDGFNSFAGVNSDTRTGIGAQLYDINKETNKGSKLDVTARGIFYTKEDESGKAATERDIEANEVAVKRNIAEYSLVKDSNPGTYAAVYHLTKTLEGITENVGAAINIAKDQFLKSAEVKTCIEKDVPVQGLLPGEKYLELIFVDSTGTDRPVYIPIKDMMTPLKSGDQIVVSEDNTISVAPEFINRMAANETNISNEVNNRIAADNEIKADVATRVEKEIRSTVGVARIFNEVDGGGAKFENENGTASFAGVNSDTNGGIGAQLYDIDVIANIGSKLDVTKNGIYYTTGEKSHASAEDRDVTANEIATKQDVEDSTPDTITDEEIIEICQ